MCSCSSVSTLTKITTLKDPSTTPVASPDPTLEACPTRGIGFLLPNTSAVADTDVTLLTSGTTHSGKKKKTSCFLSFFLFFFVSSSDPKRGVVELAVAVLSHDSTRPIFFG